MDKLQWFKFTPTDWIMGKIQRCPEITQARFMRLICLYWNKECVLSYEDAEIEIDKEHLDILINKKIIKIEYNFLLIEFLNEQLENITETSQKRREAVLKRWAKVKQKDTIVSEIDTNVLQNDTEKSREELEKEKKRKEKNNTASPFSFFNSMINYGFDKNLVSDWLKVRKTKKATNTETAFNNFIKEIEKRECILNEILEFIIIKNWSGFKWAWYDTEIEKEKSSAKKENNLNNGNDGFTKKQFRFSTEEALKTLTGGN